MNASKKLPLLASHLAFAATQTTYWDTIGPASKGEIAPWLFPILVINNMSRCLVLIVKSQKGEKPVIGEIFGHTNRLRSS